ncbi:MAG: hydantoinase/oxoprolinase family protein [Thermoplasmata archaeon]
MERYQIGIDIGGTFTDIVIFDSALNEIKVIKILTTSNPEEAVIDALKNLKINKDDISIINHATTIATNALLTGSNLPKGALITTYGFRDIVEIGRQRRAEIYNLDFNRPKPLIPRKYRYGVRERILHNGDVYIELNYKDLEKIKKKIKSEKIETLAISLLNSYTNPLHELKVKDYFSDLNISAFISSEVDPQYREFERTSTTVVNAILSPIVTTYLKKLEEGIRLMGFNAPIYVMSSNGGLNTINYASRMPISIIESGPGAGVMSSLYLSKYLGIENIITFDMGGTTAKAGTIVNGKIEISNEFEAAGKTHSGRSIKGSGYVVRYPFIDLAEVSAGGGTIAWVDDEKILHVGPKSAGSIPGPAGYGKGGVDPTVTDANIVLGRIPEYILGGEMKIFPNLSKESLKKISYPLDLDEIRSAKGILALANNTMAKAISIVTIERGRDPRDFTLFAFGGAGPLHSCDLAEEMGIKEIIIPKNPGLFSAFGLLTVDIRRVFISSVIQGNLNQIFMNLIEKAKNSLIQENFKDIQFDRFIDVRYLGQSYEITIEYYDGMDINKRFNEEHQRIYGYYSNDPVEIVNARVVATVKIPKAIIKEKIKKEGDIIKSKRRVYFSDEFIDCDTFKRETLNPGMNGLGPTLIEGYDSTVIINPNWKWEIDKFENIRIWR